jgi:hypothetical protein
MSRRIFSIAALIVSMTAALLGTAWQASAALRRAPQQPVDARVRDRRPAQREGRLMLVGVTDAILPNSSTLWDCACDADGCYPGCFPVAAATVMEYWAQRGYPALWDDAAPKLLGDLRALFPNLFCYDNADGDGRPGEAGYEAFDVAQGLDLFVRQRGFRFRIRAVPMPTFEAIVAELDAGRPVIGAFGRSPWGSHAGTIVGYDATDGRRVLIVRPNLPGKPDVELAWNVGYSDFGIITVEPTLDPSDLAPRLPRDVEVLVDDDDPGFTMQGAWGETFDAGLGGGARRVDSVDERAEDAYAAWTPALPYDGMYEVQAYLPRQDVDDTQSQQVTYRVRHAEGESFVRRSQHDARADWIPLGRFPFTRTEGGVVRLGNGTPDAAPRTLWADAVRFLYRGPIVLRRGEDGPLGFVIDGRMRRLQDGDSLRLLHLPETAVRTVDDLEFAQYPAGAPLPSMYSAWVGQFFDNDRLALPASSVDAAPVVNFAWGDAVPAAGLIAGAFSVRWSRTMALTEGDYPFVLEASGRVRLWIDGKLEIDAWTAEPGILQRHEKIVPLLTGLHRIDVEYAPRGGDARLRLDNLPPAAPVVLNDVAVQQTTPDVTLRWTDGGDPDGGVDDRPRRFFATIWNDDGYRATSGWIADAEWRTRLPQDGRYFWNVIATDGAANSAASAPRAILYDGEPPWAQMLDARQPVGRIDPNSLVAARRRLATTADGLQIVVDAGIETPSGSTDRIVLDRALHARFGDAPVARLSWWATDTLSMRDMRYALQARELVQARTAYTITTFEREVARAGYELLVHSNQEITRPVFYTETVVYTDVVPMLVRTNVDDAAWITLTDALAVTSTIFVGRPGSTYEFRVRAVDSMGNVQKWYDGYSLRVEFDETSVLTDELVPMTLFVDADGELIAAAAPTTTLAITSPLAITATLAPALTETLVLTSPFILPISTSEITSTLPSSTTELAPMPTIAVELEPSPNLPPTPTSLFGLPTMPAYEMPPTPTPQPSPTPQPTPTLIPLN